MSEVERLPLRRRVGGALVRWIHRSAVACGAVLAVFGFVFPVAAPAQAAALDGACDVASAPVIQSGVTQYVNTSLCADDRQYWAMDLTIGDRLTVNVSTDLGGFDVYGPNVGTIGGTPQCESIGRPGQATCVIGASGRYVLTQWSGAGSFTPVVRSVPPQAGRVAGACDIASAPMIPTGVTQYTNTSLCADDRQYWAMDLTIGDRLTVNVSTDLGGFDVYGPNVGTIGGTPQCESIGRPGQATCVIGASGRYVLTQWSGAGSFTPAVLHPTRPLLSAPRTAAAGSAITINVTIRSNTPHPAGTCLLAMASGSRWSLAAHVHTTTGACRIRLVLKQRGKIRLAIRFRGARDWASSRSRPVTLVVR